MDNKQATLKDTDLAYFAGIVDGEGWIGLQKRFKKGKLGGDIVSYLPCIRVTNTDSNIINRIAEIWESLGVTGHLYESSQGPSVPNGKTVMYIQIQKQELLKRTLEAIIPHLVGKKARAQMLLRFIDRTIDRNVAYEAIRLANKKGVSGSSETTREAPAFAG